AVFIASLLCYRGLYGQVPFLFSLGLAAITSFIALKAWQLVTHRDSMLHGIELKHAGKLRRGGIVFATGTALLLCFLVHSGLIRYHEWRGNAEFEQVTPAISGWQTSASLAPMILPKEKASIAAAESNLGFVDRWALVRMPSIASTLAWLDVLQDRDDAAVHRL